MSDFLQTKLAGRYEIRERIGAGGMARVFKAWDVNLDRWVAVKILHEHLVDDPSFKERFDREAKLVASLNHPGIVQVYDFNHFERDGVPVYFMVMPFIAGDTLRQTIDSYLQNGQQMPRERVLSIMDALCDALGYAHDRGMVHRAVKPGNVMLDENGSPILTDFGIARMVQSNRLTQDSLATGTPAYMSPEQVQGEGGDARSDLYSLGCMLFEMLTGRPPYTDEGGLTLALKHINAPIPTISDTLSTSEPGLDAIILRALAKAPDERFQSARDLRAALYHPPEAVEDKTIILGKKLDPTASGVSPTSPQRSSPWLRWLISAAVALIIISALLLIQETPATGSDDSPNQQTQREEPPARTLSTTGFTTNFAADDEDNNRFPTGVDGPVERTLLPEGIYQIANNLRDGAVTTLVNNERPYENVTIMLDGTLTTDGTSPASAAFGIVFRYQDEDNYNVFAVDGAGRYSIWVRQAGAWRELRGEADNWTSGAAVAPVGEVNKLRINVVGVRLVGYVNDQSVVQLEDDTFDTGAIGIYVAAPSDGSASLDVTAFQVFPLVPAMTDHD
ncbi:MAG: serine/threonine protein kinase [Anaerolineae bacterium]|nr:serine/threonine protein kinase [Anaerolineae bacterium]